MREGWANRHRGRSGPLASLPYRRTGGPALSAYRQIGRLGGCPRLRRLPRLPRSAGGFAAAGYSIDGPPLAPIRV
jgi:hypothetical protein